MFGTVKQSGGHIYATSEVDRGTTFTLYLPRHNLDQVSELRPAQGRRQRTGTETVLVVEDDPKVRELISSVQGTRGYRVFAACDGRQGLDVAAEIGDALALVVADVIMPVSKATRWCRR